MRLRQRTTRLSGQRVRRYRSGLLGVVRKMLNHRGTESAKRAMNPQIAPIHTDSKREWRSSENRSWRGAWAAPARPGPRDFVVRVFRVAALPHQRREAAAALKTGWPMWGKREIATPSWAEPSGESVSSVESVDHLLILKLGGLRLVGNQDSFYSRSFAFIRGSHFFLGC